MRLSNIDKKDFWGVQTQKYAPHKLGAYLVQRNAAVLSLPKRFFGSVNIKIHSLFVESVLGVALRLCFIDKKRFLRQKHKKYIPVNGERIRFSGSLVRC